MITVDAHTVVDLVDAAQAGDRAAFDEIVKKTRPSIYKQAFNILKSHEDAEDATQETFRRAWQALPRWEHRAPYASYLLKIGRNLAIDRHNANRTRDVVVPLMIDPEDPAQSADFDLRENIDRVLGLLLASHRDILIAIHLEGRSPMDVARAEGVSHQCIRSRLFRAQIRFREIWKG